MDRPDAEVVSTVQSLVNDSTERVRVYAAPAPRPVIDEHGEHWMEVLREQYQQLLKIAPDIDAGSLWEDDAVLDKVAFREFREHLRVLSYDRVEIESIFFWDSPLYINTKFPRHWSAILFRVYPGDEYPVDFVVHCPERVARSDRVARFTGVWRNFGYMDEDDRERTFAAQKAAGKVDPHSTCLVTEPTLRRVKNGY